MKAATFLRIANNIEAQRRMYRNIRYMEGKVKGSSTSKLTAISEEGHQIKLTDKLEIEKKYLKKMKRNITKQKAAANCYNLN